MRKIIADPNLNGLRATKSDIDNFKRTHRLSIAHNLKVFKSKTFCQVMMRESFSPTLNESGQRVSGCGIRVHIDSVTGRIDPNRIGPPQYQCMIKSKSLIPYVRKGKEASLILNVQTKGVKTVDIRVPAPSNLFPSLARQVVVASINQYLTL